MSLDSGLREDTHQGIPLKEISGVVPFVIRDQVLKIGVITFSVHTCANKNYLPLSILSSNYSLKFDVQDLVVQDHLLGRGM